MTVSTTEICNEGIADRIATFETEPRDIADIDAWFDHGEFSVYVYRDGRGRGIGRWRDCVIVEKLVDDPASAPQQERTS